MVHYQNRSNTLVYKMTIHEDNDKQLCIYFDLLYYFNEIVCYKRGSWVWSIRGAILLKSDYQNFIMEACLIPCTNDSDAEYPIETVQEARGLPNWWFAGNGEKGQISGAITYPTVQAHLVYQPSHTGFTSPGNALSQTIFQPIQVMSDMCTMWFQTVKFSLKRLSNWCRGSHERVEPLQTLTKQWKI